MTQLNELRLINDSNILYLKKLNRNYKRNEIIKNILNDEEILIKYSINDVDEILKNKKIVSDNDESTKEHVEFTPYKESFFIKILNRLKKYLVDNKYIKETEHE